MSNIDFSKYPNIQQNIEYILPIPGGDGSTISSLGIFRNPKGEIVLPRYTQGYLRTNTVCYNERKPYGIHFLVLSAFFPKPDYKDGDYLPNHKNGIRHDNRIENLEWVTRGENTSSDYRTGNMSSTIFPIDLWNIELDIKLHANSVREAAKIPMITVGWETLLQWASKPNDVVHIGGWRIKRSDEEWIPLDHSTIDPVFYEGRARHHPICIKDLKEDNTYVFESLGAASEFTGLGISTLSVNVNDGKQRVIEDRWVTKHPWEKWRDFLPYFDELKKNGSSGIRPITIYFPDGEKQTVVHGAEASRITSVAKSTVHYNATMNKDRSEDNLAVTKYGFKFKYY